MAVIPMLVEITSDIMEVISTIVLPIQKLNYYGLCLAGNYKGVVFPD